METPQNYDTIIVGAGIAGLYAAYKIIKRSPEHRVLILEREDHIGGRMGTVNFHGSPIAIGAGVGRKRKDKLLKKLIQELRIPTHEFQVHTHYAETFREPCDVKHTFEYLKTIYQKRSENDHKRHDHKENFQEFATKILGKTHYEHFIACAGYTDYEKEAANHTFNHYGFDDNYQQPWTAIGIPWQKLLQSLQNYIGRTRIKINETVTKIRQNPDNGHWQVHATNQVNGDKQKRETVRLIVATTIDTVHRLIPESKDPTNPLSTIEGQPFLRIYGKFTPESRKILEQFVPTTTIVPGPIHKIIPINPPQGIYMIVYTDNRGAKTLKKYADNTAQNRKSLCRYLQAALGIPETPGLALEDIRSFYWPVGTHYYRTQTPANNPPSQHPRPTLYIVGEMISHNQGWVEGALESVHSILPM